MNKIIFITGPRGCGKTLHGQALAQYLDYTVLIDTGRAQLRRMVLNVNSALETPEGEAGQQRIVVLTTLAESGIRDVFENRYKNVELQVRKFAELIHEYYRHTFPAVAAVWNEPLIGTGTFFFSNTVSSEQALRKSILDAATRRGEQCRPSIHNPPHHKITGAEVPVRFPGTVIKLVGERFKEAFDETLDQSVRKILKDVIAAQQQETKYKTGGFVEEPVNRQRLRDEAQSVKLGLGNDVAWAVLFVQGYRKLAEVPDEKVKEVAHAFWRVRNSRLTSSDEFDIFSGGDIK